MNLIHEVNSEGQHRIVRVNEDGTNDAGDWAEGRNLAHLEKWLANATPGVDGLPPGIFTVKSANYQVLA